MTTMFITILNMSITASVVALAVMLARVPLKRAPKIFSYVLWSVVLFRLVFPFSIESVFSLMPASQSTNATVSAPNSVGVFFEVAGYIWLIGFIALLAYALIGYISLKRRVYFATLVRDNIFESDRINTPFVLGFISPKIYFPVTIDPSQHDYILKHEQIHIKRRDYLVKPFAYVVFAMHWFNPLMWISYFLMSKDMEMSCDEAVLREANEDIRNDYMTSLLSLSTKRVSLLNPIAFAFGESNVKERVVNVLFFKKPAKWIVAVSVLAVAFFLVGFASDRDGGGSLTGNAPDSVTVVEELQEAFDAMEALGREMQQLGLEMMLARVFELEGLGAQMGVLGDEMTELGVVIDAIANSHPVSRQEAMDIARDYLGVRSSRNFTSRGFKILEGRTVWSFFFGGYGQVYVDANTGEVFG